MILHPEGFGNPLTETEYQVKFLQEALTAVFIREMVIRPVTAPATAGQASNCFPAHTLVATEQGRRPIAEIQAHQRVWAFDVVSCQWRLCRVLQTFASFYEDDSVLLTVAGETIESTYHHPYWVVSGEELAERTCLEHIPEVPADAKIPGRWVDAGDVRAGDELQLRDGRIVPVEAVQYRPYQGWMYNFQVEELHCYAVGENGVLVHNNSWWKWSKTSAQNLWDWIRGTKPAAPKIEPNRLKHIFGKAEHALDSLVTKYGSQEKAFEAVQNAANKALAEGKLTPGRNGVLPVGDAGIIIDVEGVPVRLIGGRVQDGSVQISSFSRKGL